MFRFSGWLFLLFFIHPPSLCCSALDCKKLHIYALSTLLSQPTTYTIFPPRVVAAEALHTYTHTIPRRSQKQASNSLKCHLPRAYFQLIRVFSCILLLWCFHLPPHTHIALLLVSRSLRTLDTARQLSWLLLLPMPMLLLFIFLLCHTHISTQEQRHEQSTTCVESFELERILSNVFLSLSLIRPISASSQHSSTMLGSWRDSSGKRHIFRQHIEDFFEENEQRFVCSRRRKESGKTVEFVFTAERKRARMKRTSEWLLSCADSSRERSPHHFQILGVGSGRSFQRNIRHLTRSREMSLEAFEWVDGLDESERHDDEEARKSRDCWEFHTLFSSLPDCWSIRHHRTATAV